MDARHVCAQTPHLPEIIRDLCPPTATVIRAKPLEPYKDWNDVLNDKPRTLKNDGHSHTERIIRKRSGTKVQEPAQ